MTFEIAGLPIEVNGLDALPPLMDNLAPFKADAGGGAEAVCRIECGCRLAGVSGKPALTNVFDGKTLSLWLMPGRYVVSLCFDGDGKKYHLDADQDWRCVRTDCEPGTLSGCMALDDFIMISFIYRAACFSTVLIHASCVAVGRWAAVFIGPSGIGKSTHSRLWLEHVDGSRLINDDQPALRIMPDGSINVYGTPWSGKTRCYRNEYARLGAVFRMVQADRNEAVRLGGAEAFCALLDMTSLIKCDAASFSRISATVAGIAGKAGVYSLYNRPDREAVEAGYKIFSQWRQ